MERPTMSNDTALDQTEGTVNLYLRNAVNALDYYFGKGYARENPALVASYIKAATEDYKTMAFVDAAYEIAEAIRATVQE